MEQPTSAPVAGQGGARRQPHAAGLFDDLHPARRKAREEPYLSGSGDRVLRCAPAAHHDGDGADRRHLSACGEDALTAAIDDLLARKAHLASRRPSGDVGQGATGTSGDVDLGRNAPGAGRVRVPSRDGRFQSPRGRILRHHDDALAFGYFSW